MKKDVIYIDVEDDITAIVGKMKASKEKIIALVPPSRVGVLQSAVNMRLLKRTAEQASKHVVIISNNQSLATLAAAANIPVAKNLQSKPELAEVPVLKVDDGDVIDGSQLPVGELARTAKKGQESEATAMAAVLAEESATDKAKETRETPVKRAGKKPKVPNFNAFRKKLLLFGGGGVLLIGFLIWALWFAPRATVIITAKTTSATVDTNVTLTTSGTTSLQSGAVRAVKQEQAAEVSVQFTATGKKKVGTKASGTMKLTRTSVSSIPLTVPAGTSFSAGDYTFVSMQPATLAGTSIGAGGLIQSSATVKVEAVQLGEEYNLSARSYSANVGGFSAAGSVMSGGTSREVVVPSADDVKKASELLQEKKDESLRTKLQESFGGDVVVIEESYQEKRAEPVPSVAVDTEAAGPVTLKTTITASMHAVPKADLADFLKQSIEKEIAGKQSQKIYADGADQVKFTQFAAGESNATVRLTANGTVGPVIDEQQVKEQARGKNYGDIQSTLEAIAGIEDVDTKFWPFWVRTVPQDVKRITVEFKLDNGR